MQSVLKTYGTRSGKQGYSVEPNWKTKGKHLFAWKAQVEDKFLFQTQSFQHNVGTNTLSASSVQAT